MTKYGILPQDVTPFISKVIFDRLGDTPKERYLRESLLSKYADPDPKALLARQKAARDKWLGVEERNARTNLRLLIHDPEKVIAGLKVGSVLEHSRRTIRHVLGSEPPHCLSGSFTGGASTSTKRTGGSLARKYSVVPDVTQEAWVSILPQLVDEFLGSPWIQVMPEVLTPRVVPGNVMFFVPKNNEIERVACKEPDLNLLYQKGAGNFIRSRLRQKVGIDLNDQTRNQQLALRGAATGELATVDLSSASDSLTTQLVCELLPTGWFTYLKSLRCAYTRIPDLDGGSDDRNHENEMFSSMGNGFTFELESLLFFAIANAVTRLLRLKGEVSVYGDDIIIPSQAFQVLRYHLNFLGFKVNESKSFYQGPFRESCGKHYHGRTEVTPFYIKGPILSYAGVMRVANQLRRWLSAPADTGKQSQTSWLDPGWYDVWRAIVDIIPEWRSYAGGTDFGRTDFLVTGFSTTSAYRLIEKKKRFSEPLWYVWGSYLGYLHTGAPSVPFTGLDKPFG